MSISTPTTQEISDAIVAQLESQFNQTIPLLPKSFLRVLAKVLAGVFILLYKYGGYIFLQMFVQTASIDDTEILGVTISPLKFWGRLIGVGDPIPATNAELLIDVTVTNQVGTLPVNSQLINSDNGVTYLTTTTIALDAPVKQVTIIAASDQAGGNGAGAIGNLNPGAIVSFANPLPNVARNATVVSQVVTGANAEDTEVYRQRIIDRFQKRRQGGALSDYESWGEETPGIVNVYPYTSDCPGQVDVFCEATEASSGSPDGIPTPAQLQAVLDNIIFDDNGLASRRPANALANTFAITRTGFDIEVIGLIVNNPVDVEASITAAIEEYFLEREPFIDGLTIPSRQDRITNSAVSGIVDDVVNAASGVFTGVLLEQSAVPFTIYSLGIGEKAKALTVTYT